MELQNTHVHTYRKTDSKIYIHRWAMWKTPEYPMTHLIFLAEMNFSFLLRMLHEYCKSDMERITPYVEFFISSGL